MQAEAERREEEKEEAGRQARRRLASLERQKAQERAQLERHRRMKQLRDEISELERGLPSMSESPIAQYSLGHSGKLTMYSNWLMYESLKKTLRLPFYCLLIPAEYSVVFGHSKCLARAGAARCAPTLYFANINRWRRKVFSR